MINRLYTVVNKLFTIINHFHVIISNLYTIINKSFTKNKVFLLIVLKMDMNLNEDSKVGYVQSPY